jgi:transposase
MAKKYTQEEREEAVKLAEEIGVVAAAKRLGINEDTLYGWRGRAKQRRTITNETGSPLTLEEAKAENTRLRKELRQSQQDNEILQEALGFFAKSRKK